MPTKSYRPARDDRIAEASDNLDGRIAQIERTQLLPRVARRNKVAVQGQAVPFYLFQKIAGGRRCSCFSIESSQSSQCRVCYQTGIVGGYEKYGTHLSVFDVTHPEVRSVNVMPDYMARTKPVKWSLIPGCLAGYLETKIRISPNLGIVDELNYDYDLYEGGELTFLIRAPGDADYIPLTVTAVKQRLGNPWIKFRIEIRRLNSTVTSPKFSFIYFRYQSKQNLSIPFDVTPTDRQKVLEEYGTFDDWQKQNFWTDATIRSINPLDFLVSRDNAERWVIQKCRELAPVGIPVAWDVTARLLQYYEAQVAVPIGGEP